LRLFDVINRLFDEGRLVGNIALLEVLVLYLLSHVDFRGGLAAMFLPAGCSYDELDLFNLLQDRLLAVLLISRQVRVD
jgi:hypothetical protein